MKFIYSYANSLRTYVVNAVYFGELLYKRILPGSRERSLPNRYRSLTNRTWAPQAQWKAYCEVIVTTMEHHLEDWHGLRDESLRPGNLDVLRPIEGRASYRDVGTLP